MGIDITNVLVALIAFAGTLIGSMIGNSRTQALIGYRIDQLEKKVEKHNSVVERTYKLEKDLSTAFERIDTLREDVNELKKGEHQ